MTSHMENTKSLVTLLKTTDGREVNLTEVLAVRPALVVGTDARAGLRLMGTGIEPAHAIVTYRETQYFITPRVPAAKVLVNGQLVTRPTRLQTGDVLQLGAVSLTVAESKSVIPSVPMKAALTPAVVNSRSLSLANTSSNVANGITTAAAIRPLDQPRQIYFPKAEVSRGMSIPALISGIATILIVGLLIGYGFVAGTPASAADVTSQFAYKDGHVTVVMFEASWCHFCKQQKPILTSLASEYRGKVYNQFLDAEAPVNGAMVNAFNVEAYPVTIIFNDQGHVTAKFLGLTDAASIRAAINQALEESVGQTAPSA
jgi:thiol-disulfide isomerase/thioredoxin